MRAINKNHIEFGEFIEKQYSNYIEPKYDLTLHKMTEEMVAELNTIEDFTIKRSLVGIEEISFTIYKRNEDGIENDVYDKVKGNMLVQINGNDFFILSKPQIKTSRDGLTYKSIKGFSREYELTQRLINQYNGVSRAIYSRNNDIDDDGLEIGFLNYIENNTAWSVDYVDTDIMKKRRQLEFNNTNMYRSFKDVQKAFDCVFTFDRVNRTISAYDVENLGSHQGVYISDDNFINELSQDIEDEDIVTRLYLYGEDGISIQPLNIVGQPYLEDYSYFRTPEFMSQELLGKLDEYDNIITDKEGEFAKLLDRLNPLNEEKFSLEISRREKVGELREIRELLDIAISSGDSTSGLKSRERSKMREIESLDNEIGGIKKSIDRVQEEMNELRKGLSMNEYLTEDELKEFDYFIKESRFNDNSYTEENRDELLEDGRKMLSRMSVPKITFSVNVDDFMQISQGRFVQDLIVLGDIITLEHSKVGFDYDVRLIGYEHKPYEKKLSLNFSNIQDLFDSGVYLDELLESVTDTGNTVNSNKHNWDKGDLANSKINDYIDNALDLSNQAIQKAEGQVPMIDERGIWLVQENPDGSISPKQMRLINNVLAITNDGWNTVSTAVSGDGINAEVIRGKLGQFVQLDAEQITVGGNYSDIIDFIEKNVDEGVKQTQEYVDKNAISQKLKYNQVQINERDGIQVYNKGGKTTLRMGGIPINNEWGLVDDVGFIAMHNDSTFSAMTPSGFIRKSEYGESHYVQDIEVFEGRPRGSESTTIPAPARIELPQRFRNKNISIFLAMNSMELFLSKDKSTAHAEVLLRMRVKSFNTFIDKPYMEIESYTNIQPWAGVEMSATYMPASFVAIVVAQ